MLLDNPFILFSISSPLNPTVSGFKNLFGSRQAMREHMKLMGRIENAMDALGFQWTDSICTTKFAPDGHS